MASIWDITGRAMMLQDMASEEELDPEVLKDTMLSIEGEFDVKVEAYCKLIKNLEADIDGLSGEVDRLNHKIQVRKNNIKRMKEVIFNTMQILGRTKAGSTVIGASIQKNGGKLPLIVEEKDAKNLPPELQKIKYEPNNDAIRDALEAGRALDFAHLGERGESLRIK